MNGDEVNDFLNHLAGNKNVETTMIYRYMLNRGGKGVMSPLDRYIYSLTQYGFFFVTEQFGKINGDIVLTTFDNC